MSLLSGKRAVVTGGTRGIGRAIVQYLLAEGAEVLATGRGDISTPLLGCEYCSVDFTDRSAVDTFSRSLANQRVDILVNNAGINAIAPFASIQEEDFLQIQQVNLHAPFKLCQAVLPGMKERQWGRIVNIASIWSTISKEYRASYSASKFALDGMTAALSAEVARCGILVNCVSPGFINTELTRKVLGDEGIKAQVATVPIGRLGEPEEIAAFVAWLVSPHNSYISGQNIAIDGGFTRV
ncbi:MAG: SDR family oxidoreductase [Mariprofundales bacterium]